MLIIEDLRVELSNRIILQHIDLELKPGETHILFGPNGSGKTSLLMTIMGYPQYKVLSGKIMFKGENITYKSINERSRLGIGMSYQRPPTIHGLKTRQMLIYVLRERLMKRNWPAVSISGISWKGMSMPGFQAERSNALSCSS